MAVIVFVGSEWIDHEVIDLIYKPFFVLTTDLHSFLIEIKLD